MPEGERRLAAIMFTDIVGYTALTQENESATMGLLEDSRQLVRPIFASHGGREIKTMGDAFLVEFGSALDATLCAIAVQSAMNDRKLSRGERLALRIGVHVGDVIEKENDVLGDTVNIASRIESLADQGGICISGDVYSQVKAKLPYSLSRLVGASLKNVSQQIDVYKVVLPWQGRSPVRDMNVPLDPKRVAVLPFANFSPDPNDSYFADGMTEEMISAVSKVPELSVISRTSVMGYKAKDKRVSEIANELNVGTIMEGSIRKAGSKVRITIQLIEATNDRHLWVENFDRNLEDIFAVQSEVAEKVATSLQVRFTEKERQRIERGGTSDVEAHNQYLRGRVSLMRVDEGPLRAAVRHFEEAVRLDPNYALAYCGLSTAYSWLATLEVIAAREGFQRAEVYARRALELDHELAEGHLALYLPLLNRYDFTGAEAEVMKAVELNPNLDEAYSWWSSLCLLEGRRDECIEILEKAELLNPFPAQTSALAGTLFLYSGQYDRAIQLFTRGLELDPDSTFCLDNLGLAHIQKGLIQEGLAEVKQAAGKGAPYSSDLAYAYVKAGEPTEARKLLTDLVDPARKEHVPKTIVAGVYAVLGDKDKALEWLRRPMRSAPAICLGPGWISRSEASGTSQGTRPSSAKWD